MPKYDVKVITRYWGGKYRTFTKVNDGPWREEAEVDFEPFPRIIEVLKNIKNDKSSRSKNK